MTQFKRAHTTLFWCGESANADNKQITNIESYWCDDWVSCFGGVDDPRSRRGFHPAIFTPKENPFYFALPYGEFNDDGTLKDQAKCVPWFQEGLVGGSLLKNRWIEVRHKDLVVYAQWEDVGPFGETDFDYVFITPRPEHQDLSIRIAQVLGRVSLISIWFSRGGSRSA
jgi:hypothetical protein